MTAIIHNMSDIDIEAFITEHLPIKVLEKDKYGEVFTPINLIQEMLDKLPTEIWSNPELKWLDPANGIGNFPMVIYQKLMKGLDKWQTIEKDRSQHIIQNMLYMVEINPTNVKISQNIFGTNANICCANFLTDNRLFEDKVEHFDIIIGNPPFQIEKTESNKRQGGHGGRTLWDKFIIKSLDLLVPNGFLCFITPAGWRKPESKLFNLMTQQNQLLYLHIYGQKQGRKFFNVSQRVDLYIIQKHKQNKNTEIVDELDNKLNLNLSKWEFLPSYEFENINKIMENKENGIKVIYDTTYHTQKSHIKIIYSSSIYETRKPYVKETKTEKYKYPIVHCINQKGLIFCYTDDNTKGHFGVPKVLLNFNQQQYPVNDYEGKYGMSQITFGIPITSKKQGDEIVKAINSDNFKNIIKATKWGAFQTDWRMFKYFKKDFYKYF